MSETVSRDATELGKTSILPQSTRSHQLRADDHRPSRSLTHRRGLSHPQSRRSVSVVFATGHRPQDYLCSDVECHACDKKGHISRACPQKSDGTRRDDAGEDAAEDISEDIWPKWLSRERINLSIAAHVQSMYPNTRVIHDSVQIFIENQQTKRKAQYGRPTSITTRPKRSLGYTVRVCFLCLQALWWSFFFFFFFFF